MITDHCYMLWLFLTPWYQHHRCFSLIHQWYCIYNNTFLLECLLAKCGHTPFLPVNEPLSKQYLAYMHVLQVTILFYLCRSLSWRALLVKVKWIALVGDTWYRNCHLNWTHRTKKDHWLLNRMLRVKIESSFFNTKTNSWMCVTVIIVIVPFVH